MGFGLRFRISPALCRPRERGFRVYGSEIEGSAFGVQREMIEASGFRILGFGVKGLEVRNLLMLNVCGAGGGIY